jgi:opacity protein-like surface antigen
LLVLCVCTAFAVLAPVAAAADVVSPPGACMGSGAWRTSGQQETSAAHRKSDVIKIPQADTVDWQGSERGFAVGSAGPRRDISGKVSVVLPMGTATIDSWGGSSVRYANTGTHAYDLPKALVGLKLKLKGSHKDGGVTTCKGSVFVRVEGSATSNPLAAAGAAGLALSGGALLFAGRPVFKKLWAIEDVNPG